MKFSHISDLHLGKRVNNYTLIEDQNDILNKIIGILVDEKVQALLIAGDIYDRTIPPTDAVNLFNDFLNELVKHNIKTYIIDGNHDSRERLGFANSILKNSNIHINCTLENACDKEVLTDELGNINVYLLPYLRHSEINKMFDTNIPLFNDAVKKVVDNLNIDNRERNILIAHQFVTHSSHQVEESDSEISSIGGLDNIDATIFELFDYVALGHLHGPQKIYKDYIRYCGSPLKYSFSEVNHKKSVTIIDLKEKGNISINTRFLCPLRDMKKYKGTIDDIIAMKGNDNINKSDYVHITVTDNTDMIDLNNTIRSIFPNTMEIHQTRNEMLNDNNLIGANYKDVKGNNIKKLFGDFFIQMNNRPLTSEEKYEISLILEQLKEIKDET